MGRDTRGGSAREGLKGKGGKRKEKMGKNRKQKETKFLSRTPEFIHPQLWPLNLPDLNPLDNSVWEIQGCQPSRFSRKPPDFEVHITIVRFDSGNSGFFTRK